MKRGSKIIQLESLDDQSIDFRDNADDLHTTELTIPSHLNKGDYVHEVHVENFEQIEAEDMIDDKLFV